jgi:hypothetical protein
MPFLNICNILYFRCWGKVQLRKNGSQVVTLATPQNMINFFVSFRLTLFTAVYFFLCSHSRIAVVILWISLHITFISYNTGCRSSCWHNTLNFVILFIYIGAQEWISHVGPLLSSNLYISPLYAHLVIMCFISWLIFYPLMSKHRLLF